MTSQTLAARRASRAIALWRPNEELKLTALSSVAAGSLRLPAALFMVRRSLTPALGRQHEANASIRSHRHCHRRDIGVGWCLKPLAYK